MDYSSYTQQDDQQQQYQQYQYQSQQDSYNSSQYRQSYEYYSQHHSYPYHHFPHDYANSYAHQTHHQFHHEPTSIHPPGVPIPPPEPEPNGPQNQQNGYYYPHGLVAEGPPGSGSDPGLTSGFDPVAAVAALSQLAQFPGNVDAAQRALHVPIGHTPFRGGRRGNRPFRGGRGHFGRHGPRLDGSAPSFRGRGRGQGGGRHFGSHGAVFTNLNTASMPAEGEAASLQQQQQQQQPSASVPGQAPLPVPAQVPAAPFCRPPRMAWCELCRVDCNTPEILEQHKNGKRHKKNLQVFEELQKLNKVTTGQQNAQMPYTELKTDVGQPEKNQLLSGKTSQAVTNDNSNETEQQFAVGDNSETSAEPERKQQAQFPARGRGSKRKMRGGRGGKYMRGGEGSRRLVEPPKPKQVIPLICELCNVKCESQVVFDSHLTGKKHQLNLKRFHGHRALYGEAGLQALYPPNYNAPSTSLVPQAQQGVNDPQVLLAQLLMTYVLSHAQASGAVGIAPTAAPAPAPQSSFGAQNQPNLQTQGTEPTLEDDGNQNAPTVETKSDVQSLTTEFDTKTENETSDVAAKDELVPIENAVTVPGENSGASEQVSGTVSEKA